MNGLITAMEQALTALHLPVEVLELSRLSSQDNCRPCWLHICRVGEKLQVTLRNSVLTVWYTWTAPDELPEPLFLKARDIWALVKQIPKAGRLKGGVLEGKILKLSGVQGRVLVCWDPIIDARVQPLPPAKLEAVDGHHAVGASIELNRRALRSILAWARAVDCPPRIRIMATGSISPVRIDLRTLSKDDRATFVLQPYKHREIRG